MELIDIYGRSAQENATYDLENCWFGRILSDEKGKFEGVVEDYFEENKYFIFGDMTPASIVVTRCAVEDKEMSKKFDGLKEREKYYGTVSAVYEEQEEVLGECRISLQPAELTREITNFELTRLKRQMEEMKKQLGPNSRNLYQTFSRNRDLPKEKIKK